MGRHSAADNGNEQADGSTPVAPAAGLGGSAQAMIRGGHADLQLLRQDSALRARCLAGLFVPFVLYTVLMVAIGGVGAYAIWVWVPTVIAGLLVGLFLDIAHHAARRG
ncbi:MAG: hypothetical protein M3O28_05890 [Actinomycetota bacterium]|nr:hypothetical protein [Actinomycetota bacterium]